MVSRVDVPVPVNHEHAETVAGRQEVKADMSKTLPSILFLESSKNYGGQERRLLTEALWFAAAAHRVVIAAPPDSQLFAKGTEAGVTVVPVAMRNSVSPAAVARLCAIVWRHRIDVIYSHSGKDSWLGGLCGFITGAPLVRSRELLTAVKHASAYNLFPKRILACSASVRQQLIDAGVDAWRVFVQYPPVATSRYRLADPCIAAGVRRELALEGHYPVIACVGQFRAEKRQVDIVHALRTLLAEFPEALLLLVGSGWEMAVVEAEAVATGVGDRVRFLGEREDVPAILANADLFVLPSTMEPFGMSPVEAMAAGVPVIVTRTGGLAEIVTDGVDGLLVPCLASDAIATAIIRICRDPELHRSLALNGRKRAAEFDTDIAMEKLGDHFRDVAAGRTGR